VNVSCNGGANGSANVTATGGTAAYTYSWNTTPSSTSAAVSGLTAGTYSVTVTDSKGCSIVKSVIITQPAALTATISQTNVTCNGMANGTATVTPAGGTSPYTYSWNTTPSLTTATATGLVAGTYSVTVTDNKGCSIVKTVVITQPTAVVLAPTATSSACTSPTGTASANASGGTPGYIYSWGTTSPVQTTATATNLSAGVYSVLVTDMNGCQQTANVTVTNASGPSAAITSSTQVLCNGGNNGSATVTATGGATPYTYNWSNGQVNSTATNLTAGTYTATVTDNGGCSATATVVITQPTVLAATTTKVNVSCNGGANGSANVTATGGTPAYTYSWNTTPASTSPAVSGLAAGTYSVTVTDANGCSLVKTVIITQPPVLAATTTKTNVSCNGGSNGTGTVTASGGTSPYTYSWNTSPAQTTAAATSLSAGTYSVTVTDSKGCSLVKTVVITEPPVLAGSVSAVNVTCFGASTGSATATITGGTAPYTYSWNTTPAQTTATASNLTAGTYSLLVTDSKGCTLTKTVTITQPSALAGVTTASNATCFGAATGSANVTVSGGTPGYTYSWTNGSTTPTATSLAAGTYSVTITDNNGCTLTKSVVITQPAALAATTSKVNVSCNGGSNGSATITVTGGTSPYVYSWSTGAASPVVSGLAAGTYSVTATDANGCTISKSVVITEPAALTATTSASGASCFGASTGNASITVGGGTSPYAYSWSSGHTTPVAGSLAAGTYTVTATDANGCSITKSVTIIQPNDIVITSTTTNATCGNANGSAALTVSGGVGGYSYTWNPNVSTTSTASGLASGMYNVTVTDANGCSKQASIVINNTGGPNFTVSTTDVSCNGGFDGSAAATVTSGTGPFTYSWNPIPFETDSLAQSLQAGSYSVTVTDGLGCSASSSFVINQPTAMTLSFTVVNASVSGASDGSITASTTGGTPFYTYSWNTPPPQNNANVSNLSAGTYSVCVTDVKGCQICSSAVVLDGPTDVAALTAESVKIYPNPAHDKFTLTTGKIDHEVLVTLFDAAGKLVIERRITREGDEQFDVSFLAKGVYMMRIINGNTIRTERIVKE
jgi:hypothetical protein